MKEIVYNKKEFAILIKAMQKQMESMKNPESKAFWAYSIWSVQETDRLKKGQSDSKTIARFAFGVGITSLVASLLSLSVVLYEYGT